MHLLGQMYSMALNVIRFKGCQRDDFKIGYHAEPSMQHLHMHVISTDFNSPTLRTQRHWNSFHTKLFIPHQGKSEHGISFLFKLHFGIFHRIDCTDRRRGWNHTARLSYNWSTSPNTTEMPSMQCKAKQNFKPQMASANISFWTIKFYSTSFLH